jgi:ATP-dependent Clp protease ATP-binding subunit ClpC
MRRLRDQMAVHGATIELTDSAKELLVEEGHDPAMGARPLRRAIQRLIEDPLADFVLGRELNEGATIIVDRRADAGPEETKVDIRIVEGEVKPEPVAVPAGDEPPADADEPSGE